MILEPSMFFSLRIILHACTMIQVYLVSCTANLVIASDNFIVLAPFFSRTYSTKSFEAQISEENGGGLEETIKLK